VAGGCKTFTFRAQRKLCKTFTLGRHITRQAGITCHGLNELPLPNRQRFLCFCKENSRWKNKFRGPGKYAGDDKLGWGSAKKNVQRELHFTATLAGDTLTSWMVAFIEIWLKPYWLKCDIRPFNLCICMRAMWHRKPKAKHNQKHSRAGKKSNSLSIQGGEGGNGDSVSYAGRWNPSHAFNTTNFVYIPLNTRYPIECVCAGLLCRASAAGNSNMHCVPRILTPGPRCPPPLSWPHAVQQFLLRTGKMVYGNKIVQYVFVWEMRIF